LTLSNTNNLEEKEKKVTVNKSLKMKKNKIPRQRKKKSDKNC